MTSTQIKDLLESKGVRATHQRISVYRAVCEHPIHPCASAIYDALKKDNPALSLATVYNSVEALCGAGLLRRINVDDNESRYDADMSRHGHFKCDRCGKVIDFPVKDDFAQGLSGFAVTRREICFGGLCPDCLAKEQQTKQCN